MTKDHHDNHAGIEALKMNGALGHCEKGVDMASGCGKTITIVL